MTFCEDIRRTIIWKIIIDATIPYYFLLCLYMMIIGYTKWVIITIIIVTTITTTTTTTTTTTILKHILCRLQPVTAGRRPLACWDCGFEYGQRQGCLSLVSAVYGVTTSASG